MEKKILFLRADHDTTVSHFSRKHRADNSLEITVSFETEIWFIWVLTLVVDSYGEKKN